MSNASTLVASGRVPKAQKLRVDEKVRRLGFSPGDNISRLYEYMDSHSYFPWLEEDEPNARELMETYDALVDGAPKGGGVENLTREDMKRRYRSRA